MYTEIEKCPIHSLRKFFSPLDKFPDYVFWIRNAGMYQQIYTSRSFDLIWERDNNILYDIPLIWFEFLASNDRNCFMKNFQERHVENYLNPEKNLVFYQVEKPDQKKCFLWDECFRCANVKGVEYIFGISKRVPEQAWEKQSREYSIMLDDEGNEFYKLCFELLKKNFGIIVIRKQQALPDSLDSLRNHLSNTKNISLSKRELECLYHLCQGKTAKQIGQKMMISHRTVETFVDNIRCKTTSTSKLEVIMNFSQYFKNVQIIPSEIFQK